MNPVEYQPKHWHNVRQLQCCQPPSWGLCKIIAESGAIRFAWYCKVCGKPTNIYEPKHDHIRFSVVYDHRGPLACEVCGTPSGQVHHWMPRHIDPEACEKWPTGYLCQRCHDEWHRKVTPNMSEPCR